MFNPTYRYNTQPQWQWDLIQQSKLYQVVAVCLSWPDSKDPSHSHITYPKVIFQPNNFWKSCKNFLKIIFVSNMYQTSNIYIFLISEQGCFHLFTANTEMFNRTKWRNWQTHLTNKVLINTEKKYIPYVLRYFIVESYTMDVLE